MRSVKEAARRAGALYFVFLILGLIDIFGFSHFVVPGDATATAANIVSGEPKFRIGILTDFVTLLVFIPLIVSLYKLLRDVDKWHAMLMVLLVAVGVAIGLVNILNKIMPLILLRGGDYLAVLTDAQRKALALAFLNLNERGNLLDTGFWGLWLFPFGVLVLRSGFLPRFLGVLLLIAGVGYLTISVVAIVLPAYERAVSKVMMPLGFGEFPIIFWLLIKGAKVPEPEPATPNR